MGDNGSGRAQSYIPASQGTAGFSQQLSPTPQFAGQYENTLYGNRRLYNVIKFLFWYSYQPPFNHADKQQSKINLFQQIRELAMKSPDSSEAFFKLAGIVVNHMGGIGGDGLQQFLTAKYREVVAYLESGQSLPLELGAPFHNAAALSERYKKAAIDMDMFLTRQAAMQQLPQQQQQPPQQQPQQPQQQQQQPQQPQQQQQQVITKEDLAPQSQAGKPPKAPKAGTKRAAAAAAGDDEGGKAKKPKATGTGRGRKKAADDADKDEDDADKIVIDGEVINVADDTDDVIAQLEVRRRAQLAATPGSRSWDEGYQYLSAWRLANEVLQQKKEKMPAPSMNEFFDSSTLRVLQLGFTAHAAEIMRSASQAAKQRAYSAAMHRRQEFVTSGEDPRRGLGDIRKAAEKVAAEKAAVERAELMKKAQSKRADEETKEKAQKAKAEIAGQQQANAANAALASQLGGGLGAKWSRWGGAQVKSKTAGGSKGKEKEAAAEGGDKTEKEKLPASRSKADLASGSQAAAVAAAAAGGGGGTDNIDSADLQINDLIVALQQDPLHRNGPLMFKLLNGLM